MVYEERFYRDYHLNRDLYRFRIARGESDLLILASEDIEKEAYIALKECRAILKDYGSAHPDFFKSLVPLECHEGAPKLIKHMHQASLKAEVGPMATVAGAVAQYIGEMLPFCNELIIENGGDLYMRSTAERHIAIYAGTSPFSNKLAIKIKGEQTPLGICTSAGTFGHSFSFGKVDAAMILSKDTFLADAVATAVGNRIQNEESIHEAIDYARQIEGVLGILIIYRDKLGVWGDIEIEPLRLKLS